MKSLVFVLAMCALVACDGISGQYLKGDEATLEFVGPDWSKYFEADANLDAEKKQRRRDVLKTWKARIEQAKKGE